MSVRRKDITVVYTSPAGETKRHTTRFHLTPGTNEQQVIMDLLRNGFRVDTGESYVHIPAHRITAVEYTKRLVDD